MKRSNSQHWLLTDDAINNTVSQKSSHLWTLCNIVKSLSNVSFLSHAVQFFTSIFWNFKTNFDFWLPKVVQQHNQSVVGNYVRFLYQVSCAFQRCINFKNLLRFDKVRESLKVGTFLRQSVQLSHMKHFCVETEVRLRPTQPFPETEPQTFLCLFCSYIVVFIFQPIGLIQ